MNRWRNKVAVVTGASSGIGAAICKKLAENGVVVVGLARRIELVQQLANQIAAKGGKLYPIKCDVSNTDEIKKVFSQIKTTYGPIQILINNAAYMKNGLILEEDVEELKQVLDTNILGTTICAKEAILQMKEDNLEGHIINMNSIMGHAYVACPNPVFNMYPTTKYGITILCRTLQHEVQQLKAKVKITSISPGLVGQTDFFKTAQMNDFNEDVVSALPHILPEDIADGVIYALGTPPNLLVAELTLKHTGEYF